MKIRALTLENVRKFAGKTATISDIGDGVTVVSEANEFGKSTFFDALHALFFQKYTSARGEVKSLQPRSGGAVRIAAELETDVGRFRIEKSFLAQKRAVVCDADSGALVARDDEAEAWIADLMDNGLEGPAGLLWVRQGITALEPVGSAKAEKDRLLGARRDLISSVAGEIDMVTGGRRMDRVLAACRAALDPLATSTGRPRANGAWETAQKTVAQLQALHDGLERQCTELAEALDERRRIETELAGATAKEAQETRRADLERAEKAHAAAEDHAQRCARARTELDLKTLQHRTAARAFDDLLGARTALDAATRAHDDLRERLTAAETARADAETRETASRAERDGKQDRVAALDKARDAAQRAETGRNASERVAALSDRLQNAERRRAEIEAARASLDGQAVTERKLSEINDLHARLQLEIATAQSRGMSVMLHYDGAARVGVDGQELAADTPLSITRRSRLELPGIGHMIVDPGTRADAEAAEAALHTAQSALDKALRACGVPTVEAAQQALRDRTAAKQRLSLAEGILATLAPDGIDALRADLARAQVQAKAAAVPDDAVEPAGDPAELGRALDTARAEANAARAAHERDTALLRKAQEDGIRLTAQLAAARGARDAAAAALGDPATYQARHDAAARALGLAETELRDANAALETLTETAPDLKTAAADLDRARSAVAQADRRIADLRARLTECTATIRARADDGVEAALAETRGRLDSAKAREARLAGEVAALRLLASVLEDTRARSQDAYFGPIKEELRPLLAILHGDAALSFDPDSLLPTSLARGQEDEDMQDLSGGTQEQIAILTRLAFARLFARQGRAMPVILDDALVYSDDDRIVRMFTALHRVATDQQVIVFSCRQMAFERLGGARPAITIADMDAR